MQFSEVIGQEDAKHRLMQLVEEQRVPHALMLTGPVGCGKMALALAFASYLLVLAPVLIVYIFCQKWIMNGVVAGAVK